MEDLLTWTPKPLVGTLPGAGTPRPARVTPQPSQPASLTVTVETAITPISSPTQEPTDVPRATPVSPPAHTPTQTPSITPAPPTRVPTETPSVTSIPPPTRTPAATETPAPTPAGAGDPMALISAINRERQRRGLPLLHANSSLMAAAQAHSVDLAVNNRWGHIGTDGSTPQERMRRAGYPLAEGDELLAANSTDIDALIDVWLRRPQDRGILTNARYVDIGASYAHNNNADYRDYWTVLVARPTAAPPPTTPASTFSPAMTPTHTPSPSRTPSPTPTATDIPSITPIPSPTRVPTTTKVRVPTRTATLVSTAWPTEIPTATGTPILAGTGTPTSTPPPAKTSTVTDTPVPVGTATLRKIPPLPTWGPPIPTQPPKSLSNYDQGDRRSGQLGK